MNKLLLFFLCFLFSSSFAANSESLTPACTNRGIDLSARLEQSDPAMWKLLQAQAKAIPNNRGLVWKIEKDGIKPSFLFGTMHFSDPRVLKLPDAAESAYRSAKTVVIETTDALDPEVLLRIQFEQPELMLFTDGSTLKSHLPVERQAELEQKLAERGIVLAAFARMKPWILSTLLTLPECEFQRMNGGEHGLDSVLALRAQAEGRHVDGLETAAEQLQGMNRMPLEFHIHNLVAMVDYGDQIDDAMETMTALYLRGEIGMITPTLRTIIPDNLSEADFERFQKLLIDDRNHIMADRAIPLLDQGDVFMAVGALHLPGKEGLIELLRARGWRVTPL